MDSNSNHDDDTGETVESSAVRAEKKRYSDRVAQQRHRQRRKDYINDLEAQLRLFKDGGESQMAQIVSENTRLRKELERSNSMLGGIRELLNIKAEPGTSTEISSVVSGAVDSKSALRGLPGVLAAVDEGASVSDKAEGSMLLGGGDVAIAKSSAGSFGLGPFSDLLHAQQATESFGGSILPTSSSAPLQSAYEATSAPASVLSSHAFSTPETDLDQAANWWLDPSLDAQKPQYYDDSGQRSDTMSAPWALGAGSFPGQRSSAVGSGAGDTRQLPSRSSPAFGYAQTGASQQQRQRQTTRSPASTGTLGTLVNLFGQADARQWDTMFTSMSSVHFTKHHYGIPPRVPLPPPNHDVEMHGMLHTARTHMNELGSPTLRDFVAKDTTNPLSREIKIFADPMLKAGMTAEFFAAYWILYLLFRWQAVLDEPTYRELPSWLRPTKLQLEIEHHFLFDQIPWPDLRDEMIKLSLTNMPEAFSCVEEIGKYLRVNMYTTYEWTEANLPLLKRDLSNLGRWKLAPIFFKNHPQYTWTSAR